MTRSYRKELKEKQLREFENRLRIQEQEEKEKMERMARIFARTLKKEGIELDNANKIGEELSKEVLKKSEEESEE